MNGTHCLKTWSTTQNKASLSSGEAEYYALVKCGCETLGLQSVMADLGIRTICVMRTDSTAAKGITNRRGHGKVKHLQTCELWLQEVARDKRIEIQKVGTKENPADLTTKHLDGKTATQHLDRLSAATTSGWRALAPRLQCKCVEMTSVKYGIANQWERSGASGKRVRNECVWWGAVQRPGSGNG